MEFLTERFIIRKLQYEDFAAFYKMQSNPQVMQYIKEPLSMEESKRELRQFIDYYSNGERFFLLWAIESKKNSSFIGLCGVYQNDKKENEIAFRLDSPFWGKGIGSEIVQGLIPHCRTTLELPKIVAYVDENNIGSVKILEKNMEFSDRHYSEKRKRFAKKYTFSLYS